MIQLHDPIFQTRQKCPCRAAAELGHGLSSAQLSPAFGPQQESQDSAPAATSSPKMGFISGWGGAAQGTSTKVQPQVGGHSTIPGVQLFHCLQIPGPCVSCPGLDKYDKSFCAAPAGLTWAPAARISPHFHPAGKYFVKCGSVSDDVQERNSN